MQCKCCKLYEGCIEFNSTFGRMQKVQKNKKTSFPKESVENADLYKSVLDKIMTRNE